MRILVTGATGLVGTRLVERLLELKHDVHVLSRNAPSAEKKFRGRVRAFPWGSHRESPPADAFRGVDVVFHLSGESVADGRWTATKKRAIEESRVAGTRRLVEAMGRLVDKPKVFVSTSAVGYYGFDAETTFDEQGKKGAGFLADVCERWEAEARQAERLGTRVCLVRVGIVLDPNGGVLGKMLPFFRWGVGGPIGSGRQWMSWIHVADLVELYLFLAERPEARGVFNGTAPEPVRNREFSLTLGRALGRGIHFRVPAWPLRVILGEMGNLALEGQRAIPRAALDQGFQFRFARLEPALEDLLSAERSAGSEKLRREQFVPMPVPKVFEFFSDANNLETITPPTLRFKVLGKSTTRIEEGTLIDYRLKLHGIPLRWQSRIECWQPGKMFVDRQLVGPYRHWYHRHTFRAVEGGTLMIDEVEYRLPLGRFGKVLAGTWVRKELKKIFDFRARKIEEIFLSQHR
jgi:uncharacterized protein (TIGR01777 family)